MPSKGVLDRQRIGNSIVAAARTHAAQVGERLEEILSPFLLEGETFTPTTFQLVLARTLEDRLQKLVAADNAHLLELDDDQDPRIRRDEAAQTLYDTVVGIRETLNAAFSAPRTDTLLGIKGKTPADPLKLLGHAQDLLDRLREPTIVVPEQRFGAVQIDLSRLADELQPALDELAEALSDVTREQRETEITLGEKTTALEAFDAIVGGVARALIGFDEMTDHPDFAKKIRLNLPQRGGATESEGGPEGEPSGEEEEFPGEPVPEAPGPRTVPQA